MVILAVSIAVFAFYFRVSIANLVSGLTADAEATWIDFNTLVWPTIRATVLAALGLSLIPWLLFLLIMLWLVSYASENSLEWIKLFLPFYIA